MAFIGKKPTDAPLTSSDVADGIITNAKLAQDIISADTALGAEPADTDEFLVSDAGTLKRMDYSHIKASPGLVKVHQISETSEVGNIAFSSTYITSTYGHYLIIGNVKCTTDDRTFGCRFSVDGTDDSGSSDYAYEVGDIGASDVQEDEDNTYIELDRHNLDSQANGYYQMMLYLHNPTNSDILTSVTGQATYVSQGTTDDNKGVNFSGHMTSRKAHNGIKFFMSADNMIGKLTLYGLTGS